MTLRTVKPKKCRECKAPFIPRRPLQPTCDDIACKTQYALYGAGPRMLGHWPTAQQALDEADRARAGERAAA